MTPCRISSLNRSQKRSVIRSETAAVMRRTKYFMHITSNEYLFSDRPIFRRRVFRNRLVGPIFLFYPGYIQRSLSSLSVETTSNKHSYMTEGVPGALVSQLLTP